MVARDRIELPTRGFSGKAVRLKSLNINELPGRPLRNLHHNARLCTTHSPKTHARHTSLSGGMDMITEIRSDYDFSIASLAIFAAVFGSGLP